MPSMRLHPVVLCVGLVLPLFMSSPFALAKPATGTAAADDTDDVADPFKESASATAPKTKSRTLIRDLDAVLKPKQDPVVPKADPDANADGSQGEEPMLPGSPGKGDQAGRPQLKMRYHGVAPGRGELPPHPPRLPMGKGPQRMTWPGFQVKDGTPTVFLQVSGPVEYSVSEKPGQVLLILHDTVVNVRNNLRPLRVEAFRTPVQRIRIDQKKNTVTVIVEVKGQVAHQERLSQVENGYSMLVMQVNPMTPVVPEAKPEAKVDSDAKPDADPDKDTGKAASP